MRSWVGCCPPTFGYQERYHQPVRRLKRGPPVRATSALISCGLVKNLLDSPRLRCYVYGAGSTSGRATQS